MLRSSIWGEEEVKYYNRQFLNKEKGTAFSELVVNTYPAHERCSSGFEGRYKIADCSRHITLEFEFESEEERVEVLAKIERLTGDLERLKEFVTLFEIEPPLKEKENGTESSSED